MQVNPRVSAAAWQTFVCVWLMPPLLSARHPLASGLSFLGRQGTRFVSRGVCVWLSSREEAGGKEKMNDIRAWSTQFITEFVDIYESFPCLYNIKSEEYSNKQFKNAAHGKFSHFALFRFSVFFY
jgi:hypothetical protein